MQADTARLSQAKHLNTNSIQQTCNKLSQETRDPCGQVNKCSYCSKDGYLIFHFLRYTKSKQPQSKSEALHSTLHKTVQNEWTYFVGAGPLLKSGRTGPPRPITPPRPRIILKAANKIQQYSIFTQLKCIYSHTQLTSNVCKSTPYRRKLANFWQT